jgi:hypothetical protein
MRARLALTGVLLCASLASPPALASERPPVFDPAPGCRNVRALDTVDKPTEVGCLAEERSAQGELERRWTTFPAAARNTCAEETRIGGMPSYVELLTCLEIAQGLPPSRPRRARP